jgi:heme/copper-type cytochrome/quinol oxidase subunit 2
MYNQRPTAGTDSRLRCNLGRTAFGLLALSLILAGQPAEASIFKGEALDKAANVLAWIVLIVVPIVGIVAFWLVHILPEKIAEKRKHPQAKAIQTLCLLSLVFGGMLWPIAWLWAYSKPVLYKMAYGTDTVDHDHGKQPAPVDEAAELARLKAQVSELETKLAGQPAQQGGTV